MGSQEDDSTGLVMGVIFGVIASVLSLIIGLSIYQKNKAVKAKAGVKAVASAPAVLATLVAPEAPSAK